MSFLSELRRRNVFKVGIAYAVVGWLLLQLASILLPAFEAPAWVLRVFVLLLGIGFVVALFVAWAFELTPEGIKRTSAAEPESGATHAGHKLNYLVISALALVLILMLAKDRLAISLVTPNGAAKTQEASTVLTNSVAVLPFENLSPDPDNAFFASGIHEELLNQLAKIRDLNVIARTSVLPFAGSNEGIPQIAAALHVGTVMEGSVRYADGNVRVTAQLIDAATNAHLWSETYTRPFRNVFEIETEIAMAIAQALQAKFSLTEQASIAQQAPSTSPEAYAVFVKAMELWQSTGPIPDVLKRVMTELQRVVALDPQFARPYAVLADINAELLSADLGMPENWQQRAEQLEQQVRANAERALQLDPNMGYAYSALGKLEQTYWREDAARTAFGKALALSPNDPEVLIENSWFHAYANEHDEAVRLGRRAVELDPNNSDLWQRLGMALAMAGKHSDALATYETAIDIDPANPINYFMMAPELAAAGRGAEALTGLHKAELLLGETSPGFILGEIARAYALAGSPGDAQRLYDQISARAQQKRVGAFTWALAYLAVDDQKAALAMLEQAAAHKVADEGAIFMGLIKMNWYGDPVLEQPEFVAVRRRLAYSD